MGSIITSCTNCRRARSSKKIVPLMTDCDTRQEMKAYWDQHSQKEATDSLMLLMKEDAHFADMEKAEIISYLPNFDGLSVVELGCGVGRFTGYLAERASAVLAVDFVEKFVKENEKRNAVASPHIDFLCRDVTKLSLSAKYDFVFSNWLMMYLDDEEVYNLAEKFYTWCAEGGYIFFRESCEGGASGDLPRANNPTFYRKYTKYLQIFDAKKDLRRISVDQVQIYKESKNKTNQYCFLYKKIKSE